MQLNVHVEVKQVFLLTIAPFVLNPVLHPRRMSEVGRFGDVQSGVVPGMVGPGKSYYEDAFFLFRSVDFDAVSGNELGVDVNRPVPHVHRAFFVLVGKLLGEKVVKLVSITWSLNIFSFIVSRSKENVNNFDRHN